MKYRLFLSALVAFLMQTSYAQDFSAMKLRLEVRADYQREYLDGSLVDGQTGFKGKYLNLILSGHLTENITYTYRQRFNKAHSDNSFFDATDFLFLDWAAAKNLSLSAGKQVVAIGGYEYDRAPVDLYFCSEYWNNIPCYQWGVSATVSANEGNDKLLFQVCESPFRKLGSNKDIYAYNLLWMGSHGSLSTLCSANLQEYDKGKYISYLVLGSEMKFSGKTKAHLDVMNRASDHQAFWFRDCSVMAELSCTPTPQWNLFAKVTYDVNKTNSGADYCVMPGTEITRVGGGLEFYPYRDDRLRLHANYCYTFGKNGNPDGVLADRQSQVDVGLTWRLDWKK